VISYCITLRNRVQFMREHLDMLLSQDFGTKNIELCVTDGISTDGLYDLLKGYAHYFGAVRYAISDRKQLPFTIPSNNPACDKNSLVANLASCDICILTDPEVVWIQNDGISKAVAAISGNANRFSSVPSHMGNEGYEYKNGAVDIKKTFGVYYECGFCLTFHRDTFIMMRGFEESFALGFAFDDCYFVNTWKKHLEICEIQPLVFHKWHGNQHLEPKNKLLSSENSSRVTALNGTLANRANDDWARPEVLLNIQTIR